MLNEYIVYGKVRDILGHKNYEFKVNAIDAGKAFKEFNRLVSKDFGPRFPEYIFRKVSLIKSNVKEKN